VHLMGHSNV